jgi:hypothetical protein
MNFVSLQGIWGDFTQKSGILGNTAMMSNWQRNRERTECSLCPAIAFWKKEKNYVFTLLHLL